MHKTFTENLESYLEKINNKSATPEEIIANPEGQKAEDHDLVSLAVTLTALENIKPSVEFSKTAQNQLLPKLAERQQGNWINGFLFLFNKSFRPLRRINMPQTILSIIMTFSLLFSGSYAIEAAGPGDTLYKLDREFEEIGRILTLRTEKEIAMLNTFATERLEEAEQKLTQDKFEETLEALAAYNNVILEILAMLSDSEPSLDREEIREMTQEELSKQAGTLDRIRLSWPEHDTKHRHAYQKAFQIANMGADALQGPNENAPLGPNEDAPLGPNEDAPLGPNEDAPVGPNEDAPVGPNQDAPQAPNEDAPQGPNEDAPQGPNEDAPQGPNEDAPQAPNEDAPQAPNEDAPQAPNEDAPQAPNEDAPQAPNEDAPQAPNEDAPQAPNEDAPQAPNEDAPQAPNEDAPQAPNEDAPKEPSEDAPQGPNDDAPQGSTEEASEGPSNSKP